MSNSAQTKICEEVTARIVSDLEQGRMPWEAPVFEGAIMPRNGRTGRGYRGMNVLFLWSAAHARGFTSNAWITFRQVGELGGYVRKGERGTHVLFSAPIEKGAANEVEGNSTESRKFWLRRFYTVFNVAQCEGLPVDIDKAAVPLLGDFKSNERAEMLIHSSGAKVVTSDLGHPCYAPELDEIRLPRKELFKSEEHYYQAALHELTHWSGAKARCGRDLSGRFGSRAYAAEQLVAELGAAFLCASLGLGYSTNHAAYISNWIELLREDSRAIFTAASLAQAAHDFILGCNGHASLQREAG